MIDKVIKLDNNLEYYVLDEMTYEEKTISWDFKSIMKRKV